MSEWGFTGTQSGSSIAQRKVLTRLISELDIFVLHHGVCIGADAEMHLLMLVWSKKAELIGHPPINEQKMCKNLKGFTHLYPPKEYLIRNKDIVDLGVDGLIVIPKGFQEELRSGTWSTVRYARRRKDRKIIIIWPDGHIDSEEVKI